jgi:hypothetical protein
VSSSWSSAVICEIILRVGGLLRMKKTAGIFDVFCGQCSQREIMRIGDITNPNLMQWAKNVIKKDNDEVLA